MQKLNMVNGVLFTGGWAKSGLYYETVKGIFKVNSHHLFKVVHLLGLEKHFQEMSIFLEKRIRYPDKEASWYRQEQEKQILRN